jgi:hypothetical protein
MTDRADQSTATGTVSLLVQTTTITSYPTAANAFYACRPVEVGGNETEGGAASYTADGAQVLYCYNLGTSIPTSGTRVIASAVGNRWVFRFDG